MKKTISRSDWKKNYQKAKRYARVYLFNTNEHDVTMDNTDLVHTAYLYWLETKNENLFTKPFGQIVRIIKNIQANHYQKSTWYWRGKRTKRISVSSVVGVKVNINDFNGDNKSFYDYVDHVLHSWGFEFPEQNVESNDIITQMRAKLKPIDNRILDYRVAGYKPKEIEKLENRSSTIVTKSLNRIKKVMKDTLLNPFNCSKVKVLKKLSRKAYEANKAEYTDFEFGEYAEHNEYYELLTSKTNPKEGILIKEQMRD